MGGGRIYPLILPATMDCVMPYSITCNLTTAMPGINDWLFRGNSPYDPDYTGVGGYSAIGWPELSGIYQKMIARASRIVVSFKSNTVGHQAVVIVFPTTDTNSRVATASDILRYKPHAVSKVVSGSGDENRRTVTSSSTCRQMLDTSNDHDLVLIGAANPTVAWFWHVYTAYQGGYSSAANFDVEVKLFYDCHWFDPVDPSTA